ncbi:MAG: trypsin-like serine protease [Oscillatoria sp. SIO1A7]|nr:trypsin-like serine protease [Oscillatoria sp. SIO1A7]
MSSYEQRPQPLGQIVTHSLAVLGVGFCLTALRVFPSLTLPEATASNPATETANTPIPEPPQSSRNFVAAAVNKVGPAVVRLDTERTVATNIPAPFFEDPFFRRFFGDDMFPKRPRGRRQQGQGSGFIVDSRGIILTNAHVVSGADKVTVTLRDGRTFDGEVRGIDEPSDLAVVKIEGGEDLPVAALGKSEEVQVGDWAIAVGNPLGLNNTVTLGIVSTLNRSSAQVGIPDKRLDFIQTDAAINPGNSGGPLLNNKGEVIGINTAVRPGAEGIGFAIPIDKAKEIKNKLVRGEKIPHPYIGIRMITLTPELAKQFNDDPNSLLVVPEINGVLVVEVLPKSPAAVDGLRRGDVIAEIDGRKISSADQLQDVVQKTKIGQPLRLKILRGEETKELSVHPGGLQEAKR